MLGRSARRSRGRRRTPPHGCTSGQPSTTSPYPRAPIRAGTAAPCRRICDARAAAGEEACWTSLSPAETAGGLVERALRRRVTSPTARRLPGALVHPHSEQSSERQGLRRGRAENRAAARILSASPHYANPPKRAERVSAVALATGLDDRRGSTYASIEGWVLPDPSTHKPGEHLSLIRRRRELRLRMGADPERSAVAEGARVRAASSP